jgi:hypothetical protein
MIKKSPASLSKPDLLRCSYELCKLQFKFKELQLAWTGGCATSSRTRSRHVCVFLSASSPLSSGSAAALGRAFARCHGSRLLTLRLPFVSQVSGIVFNVADFSEGFHGSCLGHVSSPVRTLSLSRLSASFIWLTLFREPPEPPARADAQ